MIKYLNPEAYIDWFSSDVFDEGELSIIGSWYKMEKIVCEKSLSIIPVYLNQLNAPCFFKNINRKYVPKHNHKIKKKKTDVCDVNGGAVSFIPRKYSHINYVYNEYVWLIAEILDISFELNMNEKWVANIHIGEIIGHSLYGPWIDYEVRKMLALRKAGILI